MIARRHRLPDGLLLVLSAVMTAATLILPVLAPLEWVSLVPMGTVLLRRAAHGTGYRRLWLLGMAFCYPYYCAIYHWFFYLYPLEFTGMSRGAAVAVVILACFGLALLHGAIFAFAFPLCGLVFRSPLCRHFPVLRLPLGAAVWCIFEWMQTQTWIGVPWGRLALGQVEWLPVIQTASLLGSYLITFLLVFVNLCVAEALLAPPRATRRVLTALLAFGINFGVGSVLFLADEQAAASRETVRAAAVQGNISTAEKWEGTTTDIFSTYFALSEEAAAQGAELIVWPETVIPRNLREYDWMVALVERFSAAFDATLLVGAFHETEEGQFNTILVTTPNAGMREDAYAKRHLVPFGEYLPLADLFRVICPPLAELQMMTADLVSGKDAMVQPIGRVRVGSLICFDSIYETLGLDSVRSGANLLAVSTNDSWFYDSAAVYQHNAQSVLRAVETRRSVVRAANTGVSSIITPRGTVTAELDPLAAGQITAEVELCNTITLYTRVGNLLIRLCMAAVVLSLASRLPLIGCRKKLSKDVDNHVTV